MTKTKEHPLIKDGIIQLKPKNYRPSGQKYSYESLKAMDQYLKESLVLQAELELGVSPMGLDLKEKVEEVKEIKLLDKLLNENPSYRVVELPGGRELPEFFDITGNIARNYIVGDWETPPVVAVAQLGPGVDRIRCSKKGNSRVNFEAPIPTIPKEALLEAKKVRDEAPEAPMFIAFLPTWEEKPQLDPMLLTKLAGEYVKLYEWGGDLDILKEFVVEK